MSTSRVGRWTRSTQAPAQTPEGSAVADRESSAVADSPQWREASRDLWGSGNQGENFDQVPYHINASGDATVQNNANDAANPGSSRAAEVFPQAALAEAALLMSTQGPAQTPEESAVADHTAAEDPRMAGWLRAVDIVLNPPVRNLTSVLENPNPPAVKKPPPPLPPRLQRIIGTQAAVPEI